MEAASSHQPTEDTCLLPDGRPGHDEINLAEFPLVLLTKRPPGDKDTIEYEDHDRHPRTGATVLRKVTITGASKYGLPTIHDEDVLMGLIYLTLADKNASSLSDPTIRFTRRQLFQLLGWPDTGHYYARLKQSIRRWKGLTIVYENWWDHQVQEYVPEVGFSLLDNYRFFDGRRNDQPQLPLPLDDLAPQRSLCSITWNKTPFASFKSGYLTTLDLDTFFGLPTAAAKRAYRYLNLRLPPSGAQDFDLQTFACQHVGFSPSYKPSRLRSEVQDTIVLPLEQRKFIEPMPAKGRFNKQQGRDRIVFARKVPALPPSPPAVTEQSATPSPLIHELTSRGLGGKLAAAFAAAHPAAYIEQKIDYLDFTLTIEPVKNPAGWLRSAIEQDFGPPAGYLPRDERERLKQAALEESQRRQRDEHAARDRQQQARQKATRASAANAYLSRLSPGELAELQSKALAQATPKERQNLDHPDNLPVRNTLLHVLVRDYVAETLTHLITPEA